MSFKLLSKANGICHDPPVTGSSGIISRRAPGTRRGWLRRGSVLLMTLTYSLLFASLASCMVAFAMGNMQVQQAQNDAGRALTAAESGMSFLLLQLRLMQTTTLGLPRIREGRITDMATPSNLWSSTNVESIGNNPGIAVSLTSYLNNSGAFSTTLTAPTGTNPLSTPATPVNSSGDGSTFAINVAWDTSNPFQVYSSSAYGMNVAGNGTATNLYVAVLHCTSTGHAGSVTKQVSMDVWIQKTLKYAVYSNVAIQLGKNVRVVGDIASTYTGTNKGPPVQMFSDFHYLPNMSSLDDDLATFRGLLDTYDTTFSNRLDVRNSGGAAATAAAAAGLNDVNGDGFIDDYDIALQHLNTSWDHTNRYTNGVTSGQFVNPNTGNPYDPDLWSEVDAPMGSGANLWTGYNDGTINNQDGYAKVIGTVKLAVTYSQWQSAASSWQQWGDTSGSAAGTNFRDQFEGSVVAPDPTDSPVQFGVSFNYDQTLAPTNFSTSSYDSMIPSSNATKTTSGGVTTISNGTLLASQANGTTVVEHTPASATSGWQATYQRPVYQNIVFNNVRIPKGLNAKFVNCTFTGYTSVKMSTNITDSGGATTTDPSAGLTWAQKMSSGTFSANTTLTASNSVGFANGNNLHFNGCTFNGVMTADIPTAYTHFADSWEFDGNTTFNNSVDQSVTIMAPQTNIEMGSYVDPAGNPSTLVGVVVAGNLDIRGSAIVDGSVLVTGAGATNTTLGYFGSTDQGQAVPPQNQLPSTANGYYGHLFFRSNPSRGMPNGITIPVISVPQVNTYQIRQ